MRKLLLATTVLSSVSLAIPVMTQEADVGADADVGASAAVSGTGVGADAGVGASAAVGGTGGGADAAAGMWLRR